MSSRRRHTRLQGDWSSDVCSSDLDKWVLKENTLWQAPVGGMSAPVAFNGKVFALSRVGEEEAPDTLVPGTKAQEALVALEIGRASWREAGVCRESRGSGDRRSSGG